MYTFKQKYIVIMESGKIITWIGQATTFKQGESLAITYAIEKSGEAIYASAVCPVTN